MHPVKRGYFVLLGTIFLLGGIGVIFELKYPDEWYVVPFSLIAAGIGSFILFVAIMEKEI